MSCWLGPRGWPHVSNLGHAEHSQSGVLAFTQELALPSAPSRQACLEKAYSFCAKPFTSSVSGANNNSPYELARHDAIGH